MARHTSVASLAAAMAAGAWVNRAPLNAGASAGDLAGDAQGAETFSLRGPLPATHPVLTMIAMPRGNKAVLSRRVLLLARRIVAVVLVGLAIGWTLNRAARMLERQPGPAGFLQGVAQGALMPIALPNLVVGDDVVIYAAHNTGRAYKLGYTMGVNVCGLVFFGFFFWRLRHLTRRGTR